MAFFRIKEAAQKIGVMPHVLRFWEGQFPSVKPNKTSRGQRLYTDDDVEEFLKIKHLLYTEGFSIPGAKKYLKEQKSGKSSTNVSVDSAAKESLYRTMLEDIADEIRSLHNFAREI